jgi:Rrf2 family protein
MLYLSREENHIFKSEDISKKMLIPQDFLRKILKRLEKKGLIKIKRGVGGGIKLSRKPEKITLYDVVEAIEDTVALNRCVINKSTCRLVSNCPAHPVWMKLRKEIVNSLKEIDFRNIISKK